MNLTLEFCDYKWQNFDGCIHHPHPLYRLGIKNAQAFVIGCPSLKLNVCQRQLHAVMIEWNLSQTPRSRPSPWIRNIKTSTNNRRLSCGYY